MLPIYPYPPLPQPPFLQPEKVSLVWQIPYQQRAREARAWAQQYAISPSVEDRKKTCLLLIDVQNTFCLPQFELFVQGAEADNIRLCQFIYQNLHQITNIILTLDTHSALQIFHTIFWVNRQGEHPEPLTVITLEDLAQERWQINPNLPLNIPPDYARNYLENLNQQGKYLLTIWPYHSMLGGIGHALVSAVEEAIFFHSIARQSPTQFELKGQQPLSENYSVFRPEYGESNKQLIKQVLDFDQILIAGQAKSHCVAWTMADLLGEINDLDPQLARKVYLLEDCSSPVVVPGVVDFTETANQTYQSFAQAGMQLIRATSYQFP
jgi:nicotinamidase-related amidase